MTNMADGEKMGLDRLLSNTDKELTLFAVRRLVAILSEKQEEGCWSLTFKVFSEVLVFNFLM